MRISDWSSDVCSSDLNEAERRAVTVGQVSSEGVAITKGLTGRAYVVLSAGAFLNPGPLVRPHLQQAARYRLQDYGRAFPHSFRLVHPLSAFSSLFFPLFSYLRLCHFPSYFFKL